MIENGPAQLAGFRAVILPVVENIMQTPAFKQTFRKAMEEAHRSLFTEDGNDLVVNLSQSLGVLAGSLQISNPDVAANIPTGLDTLLVDVGNDIRGMELWRTAEEFDQLAGTLLRVSLVLGHRRRRPRPAGPPRRVQGRGGPGRRRLPARRRRRARSPGSSAPWSATPTLRAGAGPGRRDLRRRPPGARRVDHRLRRHRRRAGHGLDSRGTPPIDPRAFWYVLHDTLGRLDPHHDRPAHRAGAADHRRRHRARPRARRGGAARSSRSCGAYVAYYGVVQLLTVVGRTTERPGRRPGPAPHPRAPPARTAGPGPSPPCAGLVLLLTVGGLVATSRHPQPRWPPPPSAAATARPSSATAPSTGSRSPGPTTRCRPPASPGWLFAEQSAGITAQLNYGVRALLVKTHYGIPSAVDVTGADLVVTDRAAELAANPKAVEQSLPPGSTSASAERAQKLAASAGIDPSKRDVYLCHVYCEYGATRFRTVLDDIKRFLDQNPDEVVIMIIGDYVSAADTQRVFQDAGLYDRLYSYDATQPPPDPRPDDRRPPEPLRALGVQRAPAGVEQPRLRPLPGHAVHLPAAERAARRGGRRVPEPTAPPTTRASSTTRWSTPTPPPAPARRLAFGPTWAGTPSCAPNRGTPDSPLFQINHWVTPAGSASTVAQARQVNAYDVLMPRVRTCTTERGRFPTIVGVNFVTTGDLLPGRRRPQPASADRRLRPPATPTVTSLPRARRRRGVHDGAMGKRLTGLDAIFLYVETEAMPMHVALCAVLDPSTVPGGYTFEKMREFIGSRVPLVKEFHRVVAEVPFRLNHPVWVDDPAYAVEHHVHRAVLDAPGDEHQLAAFVAEMAERRLDRSRPLWEFWVVEGLEGGRIALGRQGPPLRARRGCGRRPHAGVLRDRARPAARRAHRHRAGARARTTSRCCRAPRSTGPATSSTPSARWAASAGRCAPSPRGVPRPRAPAARRSPARPRRSTAPSPPGGPSRSAGCPSPT